MFIRLGLVFFCFFIAAHSSSVAQQNSSEPLSIEASGEAYLDAIRFKNINSDVGYFDPSRPAPPLSTNEQPQAQPERETSVPSVSPSGVSLDRAVFFVATLVALGFIAYLFVKFGGLGSISFGNDPKNARRGKKTVDVDLSDSVDIPKNLQMILNMSDRREALVALSHFLLNKVISAQGILLQRSWTARETMRRVPQDLNHRAELYQLVLASERVQFGDRDVTETEFNTHLNALRPLYNAGDA